MSRINITKIKEFCIFEGNYNGKVYDFSFSYVNKDNDEITYLVCNSPGYENYWYLKVTNVEYDDDDNISCVDVEDKILSDFTFFKEIDGNTNKMVDFSCCLTDEFNYFEKSNKERNCFMEVITKEKFWELFTAKKNSVLNEGKLNIILAVQKFKEYKYNEEILLKDNESSKPKLDLYKATLEYYNSLPQDILEKEGLTKCVSDFEKVLNFKVTDEIMESEMYQLWKHKF